MTGDELKQKIKETGVTQAEIARRLNVIPEVIGQKFEAKDIKTGFLEDLCRVLNKDMSFFYGSALTASSSLEEELKQLREENAVLKAELARQNDVHLSAKDSKVYNLWMKFMQITMEMQELYKEEKER